MDKKYITNVITYIGLYHLIQIVYFLVKYFDFNITPVYHSDISIDKLEEKIRKSSSFNDEIVNLLYPEFLTQCSLMEGFPDMFL